MNEKTYTIGELAAMAGITIRTLRHYDEIGLLTPEREENGYRIYSEEDANRLQEILAMRACHMSLTDIKSILQEPKAKAASKLINHIQSLKCKSDQISQAIQNSRNALALIEGMETMTDEERFEELKKHSIEAFEETYGQEARELYGDDAIDQANKRFESMTQDEWEAKELLENAIKVQLRLAMNTGDPTSEESKELVRMHIRWIGIHWGTSQKDKEIYRNLVQGYLSDPRLVEYYDSAAGEGATKFLVDAILANS